MLDFIFGTAVTAAGIVALAAIIFVALNSIAIMLEFFFGD